MAHKNMETETGEPPIESPCTMSPLPPSEKKTFKNSDWLDDNSAKMKPLNEDESACLAEYPLFTASKTFKK